MTRFRIEQRMWSIRRTRATIHANGPHRSCLEDTHQLETNHLEQREKCHDEARPRLHVGEQVLETAGLGLRETRHELLDSILDRYLLGGQVHLRPVLRA